MVPCICYLMMDIRTLQSPDHCFFLFFFEKCMSVYAVTERLLRSRCTLALNLSCCYHFFFLMAAAPFLTFYFFFLFAFLQITKQTISTSHTYAHTQKKKEHSGVTKTE